jgi:hypothetical protein
MVRDRMRALGIDWLPDRAKALFSLGANQRQTVVEWTYRHSKKCFGGPRESLYRQPAWGAQRGEDTEQK